VFAERADNGFLRNAEAAQARVQPPTRARKLFLLGHKRAAPTEGMLAIFRGYVAPVARKAEDRATRA
jgi:hypothetical protein